MVTDLVADFHFQRPLWLLAIPLGWIAVYLLTRVANQASQWQRHISSALLPYLLDRGQTLSTNRPWPALILALTIAGLAMAGPSWEKLPQPVHKSERGLVILLDMSPSMMAQDLKPSRLVRARLALIDLLSERREGTTALIAFAGEAHVVTPLTDDTDTIISLLPALSPAVMPLAGSNAEMAFDQALQLFKEAGQLRGDILYITDGIVADAASYITSQRPEGMRISVLGVGTLDGAPIPLGNGGFARDNDSSIVLAKLDANLLMQTARSGVYSTVDTDLAALNQFLSQDNPMQDNTSVSQREFDVWQDRGPWLCLLLIPFLASAFRRGWLLMLPLSVTLLPEPAVALEWQDLWQTPDQRAQQLLQRGDAAAAAETFARPDWKGSAQYQSGDYQAAIENFALDDTASGHYNRGNALAKHGALQDAIDAYDQALQHNPQLEDAKANKALVEKLLEQQQQDQQQEQNQGSDSDQSENQQQSQQNSSSDDAASQQTSDSQQQDSESSRANGESQTEQDQSTQQASQSDQQDQAQQESQQAAAQQPDQQDTVEQNQTVPISGDQLSEEERQEMEQWLRKIPDDPSGLMRRKFKHEYRQRRQDYRQGNWQPPENAANDRW